MRARRAGTPPSRSAQRCEFTRLAWRDGWPWPISAAAQVRRRVQMRGRRAAHHSGVDMPTGPMTGRGGRGCGGGGPAEAARPASRDQTGPWRVEQATGTASLVTMQKGGEAGPVGEPPPDAKRPPTMRAPDCRHERPGDPPVPRRRVGRPLGRQCAAVRVRVGLCVVASWL